MEASTYLQPITKSEQGLDPQDWSELRQLGHRMVDDMIDRLATVAQRPVWQPIPSEVRQRFQTSPPIDGEGAEKAYEDFRRYVLPYAEGNLHPRFWAWVIGAGSGLGMLADMLAAGINPNLGSGDHAPTLVERQVIDWMKQAFGFPTETSGLLATGASMANIIGLAVARHAKAGLNVKEDGLFHAPARMMFYGSSETHNSIIKGLQLLGFGKQSFCPIEAGADFKINISALQDAILRHKHDGLKPLCVIGNAGTVNTGAVDDLAALADLSAEHGLWFHVDGAIGAPLAISDTLRPMLRGMERADSLAFDLHKWMQMPYDVGCVLVRDESQHREAFSEAAGYLSRMPRGLCSGERWLSDYGPELSRGFRALKVWMCLKEHGLRKYGELFEQNIEQARYLAGLVESSQELELVARGELNIVCLRYRGRIRDEQALNALNRELLMRLQEQGIAAPSVAFLGGKFALRVSICNHRSRSEDFDLFVREALRIGREIEKSAA
jgi:glutamate/tyrosine decarboxylase-like PLP-dependent enzyme